MPLGSTSVSTTVQIEGRPVPVAELPEVQFRRAMHNYFETMGIPDQDGPQFRAQDDSATAPPVAVINETMARRLFPNQDPVGQHVRTGPNATGPWTTIVGVIGDIRHGGLEEVPQPELYISYLQGPPVSPFIVLRASGDPALLTETVRAEARRIDKNLPIYDMRTMTTLRVGRRVDAAIHPADRRRVRRARARPRGDWRLRRDVADRQRAHPRSRRPARPRRAAGGAVADDCRPGRKAGRHWRADRRRRGAASALPCSTVSCMAFAPSTR